MSEHVRALLGTPRMFALVRDDDEDGAEVVAYGLSLPGGDAATIGVRRPTFGYWTSAQSAARRLRSELIWLEGDGRLSTS
ncbi:hypothetical protein [Thermopolyspora flexuosa]|uniref:hypothetical protein n=1 Tax=Thermopolyspora flexuosa TaxID=103836 RepID=UPI001150FF3B|nr:hypothetical protein [Thermopolyspora flexuosa]